MVWRIEWTFDVSPSTRCSPRAKTPLIGLCNLQQVCRLQTQVEELSTAWTTPAPTLKHWPPTRVSNCFVLMLPASIGNYRTFWSALGRVLTTITSVEHIRWIEESGIWSLRITKPTKLQNYCVELNLNKVITRANETWFFRRKSSIDWIGCRMGQTSDNCAFVTQYPWPLCIRDLVRAAYVKTALAITCNLRHYYIYLELSLKM